MTRLYFSNVLQQGHFISVERARSCVCIQVGKVTYLFSLLYTRSLILPEQGHTFHWSFVFKVIPLYSSKAIIHTIRSENILMGKIILESRISVSCKTDVKSINYKALNNILVCAFLGPTQHSQFHFFHYIVFVAQFEAFKALRFFRLGLNYCGDIGGNPFCQKNPPDFPFLGPSLSWS